MTPALISFTEKLKLKTVADEIVWYKKSNNDLNWYGTKTVLNDIPTEVCIYKTNGFWFAPPLYYLTIVQGDELNKHEYYEFKDDSFKSLFQLVLNFKDRVQEKLLIELWEHLDKW